MPHPSHSGVAFISKPMTPVPTPTTKAERQGNDACLQINRESTVISSVTFGLSVTAATSNASFRAFHKQALASTHNTTNNSYQHNAETDRHRQEMGRHDEHRPHVTERETATDVSARLCLAQQATAVPHEAHVHRCTIPGGYVISSTESTLDEASDKKLCGLAHYSTWCLRCATDLWVRETSAL